VEPYLRTIEDLKLKQREKEAEIVTLKYAILEMDRKYQDLEKKLKASPSKAPTAAGKTTSRTGSRAPTGVAPPTPRTATVKKTVVETSATR
jgi:hypothetical protein